MDYLALWDDVTDMCQCAVQQGGAADAVEHCCTFITAANEMAGWH